MRKRNIPQFIFILPALLALLAGSSFLNPAYSQIYDIGDIYHFADGDSGVVCYVEPDNPHRGWVVAFEDVGNGTSYQMYSSNDVNLSLPGFIPGVDSALIVPHNELSWGSWTGWESHGEYNTKMLLKSGNSLAAKAVGFYNGWYIPDMEQLRIWYSLVADFQAKGIVMDYPTVNNNSDNCTCDYWTSTYVLNGDSYSYGSDKRGFYSMQTNTCQFRQITPTSLRKIRAVRDFQVEDAIAYWVQPYPNDTARTGEVTIWTNHDTVMNWNIVYDRDTISGTGTAKVYPKYDQNHHPVYEAQLCQADNSAYEVQVDDSPVFVVDVRNIGNTKYKNVTIQSSHGCDSTLRLKYSVKPTYFITEYDTICAGTSKFWHGDYYTTTGVYFDSLKTVGCQCDSVHKLVLFVSEPPVITVTSGLNVCTGESLNITVSSDNCGGAAPFVVEDFANVNGGTEDEITSKLSSKNALFVSGEKVFESPTVGVVKIGSSSGIGSMTSKALQLGDTAFVVKLKMKRYKNSGDVPAQVKVSVDENDSQTQIVADSSSYIWYSFPFAKQTNSSTIKVQTVAGSLPGYSYDEKRVYIDQVEIYKDQECVYAWSTGASGPSLTVTPTSETQYTLTVTNADGCTTDSTLTVRVITSTPPPPIEISSCGSYYWDISGLTYNTSGTYTYTVTGSNGCSFDETLELTIKEPTTSTDVQTACDKFTWIDGITYTASNNTATYTLTNSEGCDSVVKLDLTINHSLTGTAEITRCDSYTWIDGVTYTESTNMPKITLTSASGCDSVVTLNLTINHKSYYTDVHTECDSYTWIDGNTYTESNNTAQVILTNSKGCDSVVTLDLTILHTSYYTDEHTECDKYTWIDGNTYTESNNTATYTTTNAAGCDSVVTLDLTINHKSTYTDVHTACGSFVWTNGNGRTYYTSNNTATYTTTNAAGCDSVVTLDLTIYDISYGIEEVSACESFTWIDGNGETYTASTSAPTYTIPGGSVHGCDSVVQLFLTINHPHHEAYHVDACGSYVWIDGVTYYENTSSSNPPTYSHVDEKGCTQVDTLYLTMHEMDETILVDVNSSNCEGEPSGSITVTAPIGSGYSYSLDGETFQTSPQFTGLAAQWYNVYVKDKYGCINDVPAEVGSGFGLYVDAWADVPCEGGNINLHADYGSFEEVSFEWKCLEHASYTSDEQNPVINDAHAADDNGTYKVTVKELFSGCETSATVTVSVKQPTAGTDTRTVCDSLRWIDNNLYTGNNTTAQHTLVGGNAAGCDSVVTLNLTVKYGTHDAFTVPNACESYVWHGTTYTTSEIYTYSYTNSDGCPSVDTLHLTILNPAHTAVSETECESFTWNGTTYIESGDYTYSHPDANGCTQVDTLHLTINNPVHTAIYDTACESYTWHDETYTVSGDYTYSHPDANGCTQVDTLHLTINNPVHTAIYDTACEGYTWHDETYTVSGDYTYSHLDANGCTQVDTLHLIINNPVHTAIYDTACESYTWHDETYTVSGDYTYSHPDANGCIQVDTLHLTIHNPVHTAVTEIACGSFTWNGTTYSVSDDYTFSHEDANGCTQVDTLHLTINPLPEVPEVSVVNNTSCTEPNGSITVTSPVGEGYTYSINGVDFQASTVFNGLGTGNFTITVKNSNGCTNSLQDIDIETIGSSLSIDTVYSTSPCEGGDLVLYVEPSTADVTYSWSGPNTFSSTEQNPIVTDSATTAHNGSYTVIVTETATNCTATQSTNAVVRMPSVGSETVVECGSYLWHDSTYTASTDTAYWTTTNAVGCDSVVTLHLTIHNPVHTAIYDTACEGYTWHDETYTVSGDYTYSHPDANGCTQVDTLHLTIHNPVHTAIYDTACESYTWHDETYTVSGDYTYSHLDANGCTQVDTLHLIINNPHHLSYTEIAYDSYTWSAPEGNGETYTVSGTYYYSHSDANGCAQVDTLYLTIYYSHSNEFSASACEYYTWDGREYTASGDYSWTYTDIHGADSTVTMHLTIYHGTHEAVTVSGACESYEWHGTMYTTSGDYLYSYTNANGCASVDTLHLTVNYGTHNVFEKDTCDTYTWHGETYTSSGNMVFSYDNEDGCPSADTLKLTIRKSSTGTDTRTVCDSLRWIDNNLYTANNTTAQYTYEGGNAVGCDSVVTLNLTVNYSTHNVFTKDTCDTYTWHDATYTASGVYPYEYTNGNGCPSTDTLKLTIRNRTEGVDEQTACDSFVWIDGVTYTSSNNTAQHTLEGANSVGCDSVVTLKLTMKYSTHNVFTKDTCDTYTWNGETYTNSGNKVFTYVNEAGCPSADTLHLTIRNSSPAQTIPIVACDSYEWEGTDYTNITESGLYTTTFTNAVGCDSVVTLDVTINPSFVMNYKDTICYGNLYTEYGFVTTPVRPEGYSEADSFIVHLHALYETQHECDSAVNVELLVLPKVKITPTNYAVCPLRDTLTMSATVANMMMDDNLMRWRYRNNVITHQDVVNETHPYDTLQATVPFTCDSTLFYSIVYEDAYCRDSVTGRVEVNDPEAPVITGDLEDLAVFGCSVNDVPDAYTTIEQLNAAGIMVSDDCTPVELLKLESADEATTVNCNNVVTRTYTITDTCGKKSTISQTITVKRSNKFYVSEVLTDSTVHCESQAEMHNYMLPTVTDSCGNELSPIGNPVVTTNTISCVKKDITYTYTYQLGCALATTDWSFTYHVEVPELTIPANGTSTVSCVEDALRPNPGPVSDECGNSYNAVYVDSTALVNTDGTGWVKFHYTYTDCAARTQDWYFIDTLTPNTFVRRADQLANISCLSEVHDTVITITNCGENVPLTYDHSESTLVDGCGDTTLVYTYSVNGEDFDWKFTYHITPPDFSITAEPGRDTVACPSEVVPPTLPNVTDFCGNALVPTGPDIETDTTCVGTLIYKYTYTDCAGHAHVWTHTYVIELPELTIPQNDTVEAACVGSTEEPVPPVLTDACGRTITAELNEGTNPVINMEQDGNGTKVYSYTYTDCAGRTYPWKFVYLITPDEFTPVADQDSTVNCLSEVEEPTKPIIEVCGTPVTLTQDSIVNHEEGCGQVVYHYSYKVNATTYTWKYTWNIAPDNFTLAEDKDSTVTCLSKVKVAAIPVPTVVDACGNTLYPGTVTSDSTGYNGCQGDIVFNYPYTDCAGHTQTWHFTYHIELPTTLDVPADKNFTVSCLVDAVRMIPANISDACGNVIQPAPYDSTGHVEPDGTGEVKIIYKYTDCAGNYALWTLTYTLDPGVFEERPNDTMYISCVSEIKDTVIKITNCGEEVVLTQIGTTSTVVDGCGDSTFVYAYQVNNQDYTWSFTYVVTPEAFELPNDSVIKVQCIADVNVSEIVPPVVTNSCGDNITAVLQPTTDSTFNGCQGTVVYSWKYSDCTPDHDMIWKVTYQVNDTIKPSFTAPADYEVCRDVNGDFVADTNVAGAPRNLSDNCKSIDEITVSYTETSTNYLTKTDTITRTWTVSDGCNDSVKVQRVFVHPLYLITKKDTLCAGETYIFNNQTYTARIDTVLYDSLLTLAGCDSVIVLNMKVNAPTSFVLDTIVLQNELPCVVNGVEYTVTGEYTQTLTNHNGCDSLLTINLTVLDNTYTPVDSTVCKEELPIVWNGITFNAPGSQSVTLTAASGADSVVMMTVKVLPSYNDTTYVSICNGETYPLMDTILATTGTYTRTTTSMVNCDSTMTVVLTVNPTYRDTITQHICHGKSYEFDGEQRTQAGWYIYDGQTTKGCDSVVVLHLFVDEMDTTFLTASVCNNELPYTWVGEPFTASGTKTVTLSAVNGCDSVVSMTLTVKQTTEGIDEQIVCDSLRWIDGQLYIESTNTPTYTLTNAAGCDSVVTLHLTVNKSKEISVDTTVCQNDLPFTWESDTTFGENTVSGDYVLHRQTTSGCDSIITIHLTVHNTDDHADTAESCQSFYWWRSDSTYTESGVHIFQHVEEHDCTHYDTLYLTIYKPDTTSFEAWTCTDYTWNNETYDTTGEYTAVFQNIHGCDSVVTLKLTVADAYEIVIHDSIDWYGDESQFWYVFTPNDSVFIEHPGKYTDTLTSVNGCDSIVSVIVIAKNLCDIKVSAEVISEVCGGDGKIIVLATPDPTRPDPVVYSINGYDFYSEPVFENLSSGFYPIVARQGGCFRVVYGIVDPSQGLTMTCPETITDTLGFGESAYKVDAGQLGQPSLNMTHGTIPITPIMPADSLITRGDFPYNSLSDWPYSITTDMPADSSFGAGDNVLTWTLNDTVCGVKTCEQHIVIYYPECPPAIDCDSNVYPSVRIDHECWTQVNLRSSYYQKADSTCGDPIPCIYEYTSLLHPNTAQNVDLFGRLYCFEAAIGDSTINEHGHIQGICPTGWYLPSPQQYESLNAHGAYALKSPLYWIDGGGDNSTGFTWLPAGRWNGAAQRFEGLMSEGYFWATEVVNGEIHSSAILIHHDCDMVNEIESNQGMGYSIRCIKEKEVGEE